MRNSNVIRGAAILLALLVTVDAVQARMFQFRGTRDQVRAACKGEGKTLHEGGNHSYCTNGGNSVICYNGGSCWGTVLRSGGGPSFKVTPQAPQSLVDTGGDNGSAAAPTTPSAPAPSAPTPPIFN